eukprot:4408440-Heterocapsa_arctica.AAC.1
MEFPNREEWLTDVHDCEVNVHESSSRRQDHLLHAVVAQVGTPCVDSSKLSFTTSHWHLWRKG